MKHKQITYSMMYYMEHKWPRHELYTKLRMTLAYRLVLPDFLNLCTFFRGEGV